MYQFNKNAIQSPLLKWMNAKVLLFAGITQLQAAHSPGPVSHTTHMLQPQLASSLQGRYLMIWMARPLSN